MPQCINVRQYVAKSANSSVDVARTVSENQHRDRIIRPQEFRTQRRIRAFDSKRRAPHDLASIDIVEAVDDLAD